LDIIWDKIVALTGDLKNKFFLALERLFFAGSNAWAQAKPIFKELVSQLTGHATMALSDAFATAIQGITAIVAPKPGKRDLERRDIIDTISNFIGFDLTSIWNMLVNVHGSIKDQFFSIITGLFFQSAEKKAELIKIFNSLKNALVGHLADAYPILQDHVNQMLVVIGIGKRDAELRRGILDIVSSFVGVDMNMIMSLLSNVHGQIKDQFYQVLASLIFMKDEIKEKVKPILADLLLQLSTHVQDAIPILNEHFGALMGVIGLGKRDLAGMLGLGNVVAQITSQLSAVGNQMKEQLANIMTQLLFAKDEIFTNAKLILAKLAADLKDHAENALPLISAAIASLTGILKQ